MIARPLKGISLPALILLGAPAIANDASAGDSAITEPGAIDQAIEQFTGQSIGAVGGAISPVDKRLRLAHCASPLSLDWYGTGQRTVSVACPGAGGWNVYVNVRSAPKAKAATTAIRRGEAVTIAYRGRGFTLQQRGEARGNGAVGDWIEVRIDRDSPTLRARIVRPGLVEIEAG